MVVLVSPGGERIMDGIEVLTSIAAQNSSSSIRWLGSTLPLGKVSDCS